MDKILAIQKRTKLLILIRQGGVWKTSLAKHYISKNNAKIKWEHYGKSQTVSDYSYELTQIAMMQDFH